MFADSISRVLAFDCMVPIDILWFVALRASTIFWEDGEAKSVLDVGAELRGVHPVSFVWVGWHL